MAKAIPNAILDAMLDAAEGDQETVCSSQPATYYEAVDPDAWTATTAKSVGDAVRPTSRNGFAYEATSGTGNTGGTEPTWPTTPGNTVVDGSITWTCRTNYALAAATLAGGDFTAANGDTNGRKNTIAAKSAATIFATGTATHVAVVQKSADSLRRVTTCTSQSLTSGGTVDIGSHKHELATPT